MRVRYTEQAGQDLVGILEFLESRNPAASEKVLSAIRAAVRTFGKHPFTSRAQEIEGLRKGVVLPSGHLIYYDVREAESLVSVLSIQLPTQDRSFSDE